MKTTETTLDPTGAVKHADLANAIRALSMDAVDRKSVV